MKALITILILLSADLAVAQSADSLMAWQQHYKTEFLSDSHSPLKAKDTAYLRFFDYAPDRIYRARVIRSHRTDTLIMATHSGKTKRYLEYAVLKFSQRTSLEHWPAMRSSPVMKLHLYQSIDLAKDSAYRDFLFLPFTDGTNGITTYGGGRYLDFRLTDIKNGRLILDFNKAYNPYCAYKEGYNCPIPPRQNKLLMDVRAGEMIYGNAQKE